MKITAIKSASVLIEHEGYRLLCDPWFEDGIYYGSWCHYPPLEKNTLDTIISDEIHGIYISHIHPDHCSFESLERFKKDTPVYIHKYGFDELRKSLSKNGWTNVKELEHGEAVKLAPDLFLEIYAADNCDPVQCGKQFGCQFLGDINGSMQIDTMSVLYTIKKNYVIVNTNDCQYGLAKNTIKEIQKQHDHIDVLLTGYVSASAYPQCFDNLSVTEKLFEKERIQKRFLMKAAYFARDLKPVVVVPFAGEYVLGGKLWEMNYFTSPPPKENTGFLLRRAFDSLGLPRQYSSRNYAIDVLYTGDFIDWEDDSFALCKNSDDYDQVKRLRYIETKLKNKKFDYEYPGISPGLQDIDDLLIEAIKNMQHVQDKRAVKINTGKLLIQVDDDPAYVIDLQDLSKPFHRSTIPEKERGFVHPDFLRIKLDRRLLCLLLNGTYKWNHAEIGSHLRFYRPNNQYDRSLFYLMNFLHI